MIKRYTDQTTEGVVHKKGEEDAEETREDYSLQRTQEPLFDYLVGWYNNKFMKMLMRMCARYCSSLVCEEIFKWCAPTRARWNIIQFIYILIGPHSHGLTENLSHHSSTVFIGSPFLSSLPPSNHPLCFQALFRSLLIDHSSFLDLSRVPFLISLNSLLSFFSLFFLTRIFFYNYLTIFA